MSAERNPDFDLLVRGDKARFIRDDKVEVIPNSRSIEGKGCSGSIFPGETIFAHRPTQ